MRYNTLILFCLSHCHKYIHIANNVEKYDTVISFKSYFPLKNIVDNLSEKQTYHNWNS